MKKYIKPIATIVNLDSENILAGSNSNMSNLDPGDGSDALVRGNRRGPLTDWDDDED